MRAGLKQINRLYKWAWMWTKEKKQSGNSPSRTDWHLGGCGCSVLSANVPQILCFFSPSANAGHVLWFHSKMKTKDWTLHYNNAPSMIIFYMGLKAGLTFPGGRVDKYFTENISNPIYHIISEQAKQKKKSTSSGHTTTEAMRFTNMYIFLFFLSL